MFTHTHSERQPGIFALRRKEDQMLDGMRKPVGVCSRFRRFSS